MPQRGNELLERSGESRSLIDALEQARRGTAAAVVIEGEPGIGKSVLLDRAAAEAAARRFTVLRARGGALEQTLGWGVARQLFENLLVKGPDHVRERLLRDSAALARGLFSLDPGAPSAAPLRDELHREHGLYWLTRNLADERPLALLIDDAHWCDDASVRWLLYLARRAEGLPLALLVAKRPDGPSAPAQLLAMIADGPAARLLTLRPLSSGATQTLLERAYGSAVEEALANACHRWTGGNPLFAKAIAAELVRGGAAPTAASADRISTLTPERASRMVLLGLARLSDDARAVARALAVLESAQDARLVFELAELRATAGAPALDELVAAGIAVDGLPIAFAHPLAGAVVYGDIGTHSRAAMHKRAALLLRGTASEPGRIAAHLLRSSPAGEQWVVAELRRAASGELERGSATTAVPLLERARIEPPAPAALVDVVFELGVAQALSGDPTAGATLREALGMTDRPALKAEIALELGQALLSAGDPQAALAVVQAGTESVAWDDPDLRLQLEALLINCARLDVATLPLIRERLAGLLEHAKDDSRGGRMVAAQVAWGLTASAAPARAAVAWARRALAGGALIRENAAAPPAYLGAIHMLALNDELDEADAYLAEAAALAQRTGSIPATAGVASLRANCALLRGRLSEAVMHGRDTLRICEETPGTGLVQGLARGYLALALAAQGEFGEAAALTGEEVDVLERCELTWASELLFATGAVAAAGGVPERAMEALLACGRRAVRWECTTPAWLAWRSEAALVLHRLGRLEEAAALCAEETELARRVDAPRPLGVALRAAGTIARDLDLLRESAQLLSESSARLEHARSLLALGRVLRQTNARANSREPLREALEIATECGALPLAQEARVELAATGSRPRRAARSGTDALTPSERRVCELAAEGKSNPEIAGLLFVTRATVESHLHSAYRRLDLRSRAELAAALAPSER